MVASLVFLTPAGGVAALTFVIPLAAVAVVARREQAGRKLLGLASPPPTRQLPRVLALVAIPVLLGIAAMQPALRSTEKQRVRTDAQAYFVLDTSRSMLAKKGPTDPTRLARARKYAIEMRDALPEIPSGVATLTDRLLPDLLPNADPSVFAQTVAQAVQIEQPPPASSNIKATSFCRNANGDCSLGNLGTQNFFPSTIHNRLAVILTDGESNPVDDALLARQLATGPGIKVIFVHVWQPGEGVYDGNSPEQGYHTDPESGQILTTLASSIDDGKAFGESSIGSAIKRHEGRRRHERPDNPSGPRRTDPDACSVRRPACAAAAAADHPASGPARPCRRVAPLRPRSCSHAAAGSSASREAGCATRSPRQPETPKSELRYDSGGKCLQVPNRGEAPQRPLGRARG